MLKNKADSLDWLDLETDVTTPSTGVGDLIIREEENNTWSILRSVDGTEPEVDPGYSSKDDALQAARLGAEGGKITIERRISKVITAAKIHAGMIARLGDASITITEIDGHDISIMHTNGEQQLVDVSQLSNIKEAFGETDYPMYQDGEPEIGHMPGMKMDDANPVIKMIEEIKEVLEGSEEVEEDLGMENMMMEIELVDPLLEELVDPLLDESEVPEDEYVLDVGISEEEAEEGTEEMAGMMTGPPVYIVDMKAMPGENQSKGAQKTAKVHMSQEKGERPVPRIDIKGILETYERIGIPVSAAEAKIGEMLLVKDADGFHVEEELVNGAIQRKGPNVAQEQAEDILATIGFNSNTTAQLIATATKKGYASLGDQMGFLVKADHYLIMTDPGTYAITDEVSIIAEGLDQFSTYDTLLSVTSLDSDAIIEAIDRAQMEPEVQLSETFGEERGFEMGQPYDLDLTPTSIPDGSDAEAGSGFGVATGTKKVRIANVKIAKEAPTCKKCGKDHWPFQKCDSAGKKEDKSEKDLEDSDAPATTAAGKCDKCGNEKCTCTKAKDKSEKGDNSENTSKAMRTAKSAPTCKKCGEAHWPFKPCSGSEKKNESEKDEEDPDEKKASKQLDITGLSTAAFQRLHARIKKQATVKDDPKLDEQCILLDREAKRRGLFPHQYAYSVGQSVIVSAKSLPRTKGVIIEYGGRKDASTDTWAKCTYLVEFPGKHQLWFKEAEVSPTSNPDTTTVPWAQRSKKIVDPENSKQNADFKKDLNAKTGQGPYEMTLVDVASEIVNVVAPEAALLDWAAGERGASYEELVESAFETYRDALLAEAHTKFSYIAEHGDLGPQLEMTLKDVLSWNLPKSRSGEDMSGMSLEMDYMEGTVSDFDEMISSDALRAILLEHVGDDPVIENYIADAMSYGDSSAYPPDIDPETLVHDFTEYKAWISGTIDEMAMGEETITDETTVDEMAIREEPTEMVRDYRTPDAYGRSYAMKIGSTVRIASTFETDIKEVAQLRDMKIKGTIVALNNRIADVRIGSDILRIARSGLEITGHFFRDSIIRRCAPGDIDPDRPESAQKWCLCSRKNDTVLGRHATKKEAVQQEKVIKAQGGIFIAAEMPEALINRSLTEEEKAISDYGEAIASLPVGSADAEVLKEIQQDEQDHADIFNKLKEGEDATALLLESAKKVDADCGKPHGTEKGTAIGPPIGGMPGAAGDSDQKGKPAGAPSRPTAKEDKPEASPEETCVCPLDGKEYPKEAGVPCTNSACQDHPDVQLVRKPTGPPTKEPVKKAFMQLAESVRCYADALLERVLTGNITSSEAVKELNTEAKRWGWSSTQKKFVRNKLQGKVAHMKRMSAEDDVSSLLSELERGDAQAVIRTLDDSTEVSAALTGLGLGDDTSDLRSWLIDAPGMSAELLQIYAQDPMPANRLLALDRIADRFPEADVSAWLQDPYPYISEKAGDIQAGAGSPLATEDPLNPVTPPVSIAPIEPLPATDPSGQINVPLAAAKDTPPGNAPPTIDYDPLGLVEDDTTEKKVEAGRLALTYDEPNARYLLYNMDFGPVSPEGAQIKEIKGQLEAYGICTDRIQEALDVAKTGIAIIKIARVANAENIDIELSDAVDAAVLGFADKSAMEGLTDGSSRGSLTMSALLEVSKRLGISKEDTSSYYGARIKELLDAKLDAVPRPEIPGTKIEFMSFQSKKPSVSKEAKTPTPEEKKKIVTDLAKHGIPLREVTPSNEPPVDIPPDRMLSTIGIFKEGDRVRDNAVTELKGTVTGFDSGGNVIVAMDKSYYCPEGGEGLYPPEGLANMRL